MPSRKLFVCIETSDADFDTERIIDLAVIEVIGQRRTGAELVTRLNPEKAIHEAASALHGLTREMLGREPSFCDISANLRGLVSDAEIIVQNANWDICFLDAELGRLGMPRVAQTAQSVTCLFTLSRRMNPGASGSLASLCKRYGVAAVPIHSGAAADANCMLSVYFAMTEGLRA